MKRFSPYIFPLILLAVFAVPVGVWAQGTIAAAGSIWDVPGWILSSAVDGVVKWVALAILLFFSWMLTMSAYMLNYAITYLVIGMGGYIRDGGFGGEIEVLWMLIRDVINIAFIFSLIYVGISTILGLSSANWKNGLKNIIICALLVNFSLFFSKAIIDVANLTADHIYRQMVGGNALQARDPEYGFTGAFMQKMGVVSLLGGGSNSRAVIEAASNKSDSIAFYIIYALGASIMLFKLTFAFALGAFLLILRFVMLIVLMIFSPVAFLPGVIPGLKGVADKWWKALIGQAFFAPVFLFGIYMAYLVLDSAPWNSNDGLILLFSNDHSAFLPALRALLFYLLATIMIIGATMMAKTMSAMGGEFAKNMGERASAWTKRGMSTYTRAGKYVVATPAKATGSYAMRNTLGRGFRGLQGVNDRMGATRTGRNIKRFGTVLTGGYLDEQKRRELLEKGRKSKYGGSYSLDDQEHRRHEREDWDRQAGRRRTAAELRAQGARASADAIANPPVGQNGQPIERVADLAQGTQDQIRELITSVRRLTQAELENLGARGLSDPNIAMHLTSQQMHQIEHSQRFSQDELHEVEHARTEGLRAAAQTTLGTDMIYQGRNASEISSLPAEALAPPPGAPATHTTAAQNIASRFSASHIENIRNRDTATITEGQRQRTLQIYEQSLVSRIDPAVVPNAATRAQNAAAIVRGRNANEIAQMPAAVLENQEMAHLLSPATLEALLRLGNPSRANLATIRANIIFLNNNDMLDWLNDTPAGRSIR